LGLWSVSFLRTDYLKRNIMKRIHQLFFLLMFFSISTVYASQIDTVNIRVLMQGFYRGGGTMVAVADPVIYPLLCDTAIINLLDTSGAFPVLFTSRSVINGLQQIFSSIQFYFGDV